MSVGASALNHDLRILVVSTSFMSDVPQIKLERMAAVDRVTIGLLAPRQWNAGVLLGEYQLSTPKGVEVYPSNALFPGRNGLYLYPPRRLVQVVREFRPDVIHLEHEPFCLVSSEVAAAAMLEGVPFSFSAQENTARPRHLTRWPGRQLVYRRAIAAVPANFGAARLLRRQGWKGPAFIVPQLGTELLAAGPRSRIPVDAFSVGYVGRLVPEKGVADLIRAVAKLPSTESVELKVVGSGPDEGSLRSLAKETGVSTQVRFLGALPHTEVLSALKEIDVLVLPSRTTRAWREQFGHVLIQGMASGLPVVGSSSGEIPKVVGDAELTFEEGKPAALAAILQRLRADRGFYNEKARAALDRAALFTNERIGVALVSALVQVLGQVSPARSTFSLSTAPGASPEVAFTPVNEFALESSG